jgi:hypothetical protein
MLSLIVSVLLVAAVPDAQPTLPPLPKLKGVSTATPTPPPLKEIVHVRSSALCSGLKKTILPVVGHEIQIDKMIATSRPIFNDLTTKRRLGSGKAAEDLDVVRLEGLIRPLNDNIGAAKKLLEDPKAFPKQATTQQDKDLLAIRDSLRASVARQENVLDMISGFVDTQQLGELQAAGNEYNSAITGGATPNPSGPASPTPDPGLLTAGVGANNPNDPVRKNDPLYKESGTLYGNDIYSAFSQAVAQYQQEIGKHESAASELILHNVPQCGGKVPK